MLTSPPFSFFFFFFSISLVSLLSTTHAFNITQILKPFSEFDTYNEKLSQTGLAGEINNQKSVTVLVVANDQLRDFTHLARDDVRRILTFHILYGYYDETRFISFASRTTLPTFYKGPAALTSNYDGDSIITFRAAGEDTGFKGVLLLDTIEAEQNVISVLQIASLVQFAAQPTSASPNASPPRKLLAPAPAPAPKSSAPLSKASAPSPSTKIKLGKKAPAPSPSTKIKPGKKAPAPSPSTKIKPGKKAPAPSPSTKTKPGKNAPVPPPPSTKTTPSKSESSPPPSTKTTPSKSDSSPPPSTKTTPSNNAPSPPPAPGTKNITPSNSAPSPSKATKPSINAPSQAAAESNSTTPPVASPPTKTLAPDSGNDEDNAPTPIALPPKPSSDTAAPAPATDVPAPAPEKSTAPERMSSGNYLASVVLMFTAARFLFNSI